MASKSKSVRVEQLRVLEKKMALRLEQLNQKGISEKKALNDPLVKNLKSKIRETNVRIAAFEKFVKKAQELAQVKAQKIAELAKKEAEPAVAAESSEPKQKKSDKETKKKPVVSEEAAPKKTKKQAVAPDDAAPKKKTSKKKEE